MRTCENIFRELQNILRSQLPILSDSKSKTILDRSVYDLEFTISKFPQTFKDTFYNFSFPFFHMHLLILTSLTVLSCKLIDFSPCK